MSVSLGPAVWQGNLGVDRQEPLRLASGLESAHLPFPLSGRLMRYFSAVVRIVGGVAHGSGSQESWANSNLGGRFGSAESGIIARIGGFCLQRQVSRSGRGDAGTGTHERERRFPGNPTQKGL
jgi:hypothetical protein